MRTEEELLEEIERYVKWIIKIGKQGILKNRILIQLHSWSHIDSLCYALDKDPVPYWNRICKEVPSLGEVTE